MRSRQIAICAIITALTMVGLAIPGAFMVTLLIVACIAPIGLVIFSASVLGVLSLLFSLMGATPIALAFVTYPYVPIVARLVVATILYGVRQLIARLMPKYVTYIIISAMGSLLNSVLIILSLYLLAQGELYGLIIGSMPLLIGAAITELIVAIVVVPPIAKISATQLLPIFWDKSREVHK